MFKVVQIVYGGVVKGFILVAGADNESASHIDKR